jgi:hypothetical protein
MNKEKLVKVNNLFYSINQVESQIASLRELLASMMNGGTFELDICNSTNRQKRYELWCKNGFDENTNRSRMIEIVEVYIKSLEDDLVSMKKTFEKL